MTPKQRVLASINHVQPDCVPFNISMADELALQVKAYLQLSKNAFKEWLGNDMVWVRPKFGQQVSEQCYADPTIEVTHDELYLDIYRVPFKRVTTDFQTYMELAGKPPLMQAQTLNEIEEFPWPTADMWDYGNIKNDIVHDKDKAICGHSRGFFEIAHFVRGMDNFMMDLLLQPEFACLVMDKIFDYLFSRSVKMLEAGEGKFDIFEYNDDIASQQSLFISPDMWREHIKPRMAKFCDMVHSFDAKVRYHSCGSVYQIIPDLIEIGVDILNPIQTLANNMDPVKLKQEFGDKLTLDGAVDIQHLLPHGSIEDVCHEVRKLVEVVGKNGGYILGGSHCLQADIPVENVVAMVETARG